MSTKLRYYTTAPKDYDWGWTTVLIDHIGESKQGKIFRLVEISDKYHADCQTARYNSGLHPAYTESQWLQELEFGFATLTPEKAVHYFYQTFEFNNCQEVRKNFMNLWHDIQELPHATLKHAGHRQYTLTVVNDKPLFDQLTHKLTVLVSTSKKEEE